MPRLKRLTIFLLSLIGFTFSCFFLLKNPVLASLNREVWNQAVGDNNPNFTLEDNLQDSFDGLLNSSIDHTVGNPNIAGQTGALQTLNHYIAAMIERPPVATQEYLADLGSSLGLSRPAYAQGLGWQALNPVLQVWKAFRNVAYLGFVIIFIVVGFMIMFRIKLGQQTAITLQAALPKLIVTLLLITFSYAIAGLMIDLIYIAIYVVLGVFVLFGIITEQKPVADKIFGENLFQIIYGGGMFISAPGDSIRNIVDGILNTEGNALALGAGLLVQALLAILLLFSVFKIFIALLFSYVGIVVKVIFAPITLLFNALPGTNSFGNWIKGLLADVAPFPAVAVMFLLAAVLIGSSSSGCSEANPWCVNSEIGYRGSIDSGQPVWQPPFLSIVGGSTGGTNPLLGLIGIGIVMMTPKIVSQIKKMLKVEGTGLGGAIMGGMAGPIAGIGSFAQTAYTAGAQLSSWKSAREQTKFMQNMADFMQKGQVPGVGEERQKPS